MQATDLQDVRTAAELTRRVLGLAPQGEPTDEVSWCSLCGRTIEVGEPMVRGWKPGSSFMDDFDLVGRHERGRIDLCGDCLPLTAKKAMEKVQMHVVSADGVYPIGKDIHRAYFLENPPEPPFAVWHKTATLQHLVWKTPLAWSKDRFQLNFGGQLLTIDRRRVAQALELIADPDMPYPWVSGGLDRSLNAPRHGQLRDELYAYSPEAAHRLARLHPGDLWAIATLRKGVTPEAPEPVTLA